MLQNRLRYAEFLAGRCSRLLRVALSVVSAVVSKTYAFGSVLPDQFRTLVP